MPLQPLRLVALGLFSLLMLVGCGGHHADDDGAPVTASVNADGGTIIGPDGIQLVVPALAVDAPVTIRIARVTAGAPAVPTVLGPTGQAYEITPHGQLFNRPVTLRFPAPAGTRTDAPKVLVASPGGDWVGTAARLVDGMLEIDRLSLSFFVLPIPYACSSVDVAKDRYACYWFGLGAPHVTAVPSAALAAPLITDNVGLSFTSVYFARPDCGGSRMQAWRQHILPDGTREPLTQVFDQSLPNIGEAGDANFTFGAVTDPKFQVTAADNGWVVFRFEFSCRVGAWPAALSNVGEVVFRVGIRGPAPLPPGIAANEPADLTVFQGDPASFSVSPLGSAPLAYQWKRDGVDIPGATGNRYTLPSADAAADQGARFSVEVSSPWGRATSRAATLTVDVAVPPALVPEEPVDQTVVEGFPASFSVSPTGTPPFSYQWKRGGVDIPGATASSHSLASASRAQDDGATFSVTVSNRWGSAVSRVATLTVKPVTTAGGFTVTTLASRDQGGTQLPGWNPGGGIAVDAAGRIFVGDGNRIRRFAPDGSTSILAGSGAAGSTDGPAATATFGFLYSMALDAAGNLYVADTYAIRKIDSAGNVSTLAGSGTRGYVDGPPGTAQFMGPRGVAVDGAGNVYVADQGNSSGDLDYSIRKITPAGAVSTLAGGNGLGHADGLGAAVKFNFPYGLCIGPGNVLVAAEAGNRDVRRIAPDGTVSTLAGDPSYRGSASVDGTGSAALFPGPGWIACDGAGNLFVGDTGTTVALRKVTAGGVVTTVVGGNAAGPIDGPGLGVALADLTAITVAPDGSIHAIDGARIIRIVP